MAPALNKLKTFEKSSIYFVRHNNHSMAILVFRIRSKSPTNGCYPIQTKNLQFPKSLQFVCSVVLPGRFLGFVAIPAIAGGAIVQ